MRRTLTTATLAAATLLVTHRASADPDCTTGLPTNIPTVFIESGDTQEPLMKRLGQKLANSATPLRIVYQNQPTCTLGNDMFSTPQNAMKSGTRTIRYIPTATEMPTWDPTQAAPTCNLTAEAAGVPIQLAIGATYLTSCTLPTQPTTVAVGPGPIEAYGFIVPNGSSQVAITAEEGYFAFGFAQATGMASPWTDDTLKFIRAATASTALTDAASINLSASKLKGTIPGTNLSTDVLNSVINAATPESAIGLMGIDVYDAQRGKVKFLAFKTFGQRYAYFPDSSATSFDKKNVRDGHYVPWSQTQYILNVDAGGNPTDANAQRVRDLVTGARVEADVDGIAAVAATCLVPQCAMKVSRKFDGDQLALYSDPAPCGCYYESVVPSGSTACTKCSGDNDPVCGTGKCRHGYCEAR